MTAPLLDTYRPAVVAELRRLLDGLPYTYVALLREELARRGATRDAPDALLPAALCLLAVEALGGEVEVATAAATSLALLAATAEAAADVAASDAGVRAQGLSRSWGLPRTINAVDALFCLAQTAVLKPGDASDALAAARVLDEACVAMSGALHAGLSSRDAQSRPALAAARRTLLEAAVRLAGVLSRDREAASRLVEAMWTAPPTEALVAAGLAEEAARRLATAIEQATQASR